MSSVNHEKYRTSLIFILLASITCLNRYCIAFVVLNPCKHSSYCLTMTNNDEDESSSETKFEKTPTTPRFISPSNMMRAMNTSPRRIFVSTLSASTIALASNFCGLTSNILENVPEPLVEKSGLDIYFPRGKFKRFKSGEYKYTFVIMKEWVQDTSVELAKIQRRSRSLDYKMSKSNGLSTIPDVAFGPPGYLNPNGRDTNLSVVVSKLRPGFTLRESLGPPNDAAETLLKASLAPQGSGRTSTLLSSEADVRGQSSDEVYTFEYKIDRGERGLPLKAISVIAVEGGDTLITMTIVAPEKDWVGDYGTNLKKVAESFKLTA